MMMCFFKEKTSSSTWMLSVQVFERNILLMILYLNEDTSVRTAVQVSLAAQFVHVHGSATIKPKACEVNSQETLGNSIHVDVTLTCTT